jgi:hypothetical protein
MTERRRRGAEGREDEHGADGVPGAEQVETGTAEVPFAADVLGELAQEDAERDEQRHEVQRRQEEHGNQDELRRDRVREGDFELDPRREGIAADERENDAEAGVRPRRGQPDHQRDRGRDEGQGRGDRGEDLTVTEPAGDTSSGLLDEAFVVGARRAVRGRLGVLLYRSGGHNRAYRHDPRFP